MNPNLNPAPIFNMMTAYQQSAALHAAIELDLFTAIGEGHNHPVALANRCQCAERGARILADYFCAHGLLTKQEQTYALTPDSAAFLHRQSPAYIGGMDGFLNARNIRAQFDAMTAAVRKGGVAATDLGSTEGYYEGWVDFAKSMEAMMGMAAQQIAALVNGGKQEPIEVLDVAASHGLFGFSIAKQNAHAKITALDWANVLDVTRANAERWGLSERLTTIEGDAFTVDLKGPYDVILLTNLLHHFSFTDNVRLLQRMKAALKPGGKVYTLEFVPNEDRISPPIPATFALVMLASTPQGDAFTFAEFESMFAAAGFSHSQQIALEATPESLIISH
jgi:2-polyprenyl-3-methyl-5-hydroxy-6-metoxy-1,4-benzoquinol methylase